MNSGLVIFIPIFIFRLSPRAAQNYPLTVFDLSHIANLTGSEHMICEFQKQHELDYAGKTSDVLKQVADRRKAMNEKNARTALDHTLLTTFRRHETTMDVTMLKKRTTTRTRSMGRVPACCSRNARRGGHPRMLWVIL